MDRICQQCGAVLPEDATLCSECGEMLSGQESAPYVPPTYDPDNQDAFVEKKEGKTVSVLGWLGRTLMLWIPLVGLPLYFVMLFVWSFGKKYDATSRNWAKAMLLFLAIDLALSAVVAVLMVLIAIFVLPGLGVAATTGIAALFGIPSYVLSGLFDMSTLENMLIAFGLM